MEFVLAMRLEGAEGAVTCEHSRSVSFRTIAQKQVDARIYYTVVTSEEASDPLEAARRRLDRAADLGSEAIEQQHLGEWNEFWSRSYLRLSEDYLENLWYLHLYYMASCNGGKYPARFIDALWP